VQAGLKLEFVYGYAGHNNTCSNLFWTADFKIVYYLAALGIVYDPVTHTQTFYEARVDNKPPAWLHIICTLRSLLEKRYPLLHFFIFL
jgi:hypothetical protein